MVRAQEIRDGLFSISWNVPNFLPAVRHMQDIKYLAPSEKVVGSSATCWLNGNNSEIVLELKTAVAPDSLKNALVTASYLGIKHKIMLNKTSIWKASWGWNLPSSVQPTAGWIVRFEILICNPIVLVCYPLRKVQVTFWDI